MEEKYYECKSCGLIFEIGNHVKCPGCWSVNMHPVPETANQERDRLRAEVARLTAELGHALDNIEDYKALQDWAKSDYEKLQAELQQAREANRWIPVGERLPELYPGCKYVSDQVLVSCIGDQGEPFMAVAYYDRGNKGWHVVASGFLLDCVITHWRPLPTPPEDTMLPRMPVETKTIIVNVTSITDGKPRNTPPDQDERPPYCQKCGVPVVWCMCDTTPPEQEATE